MKPGALAKQSAAVQGLPALESLLFSGKAALLLPAPPEPFRCKLAVAVAENMHTIAGEVVAGWQGDKSWATLLENPAADNPVYRTHTEAMTEILKAILTGIEQVRDQRLLPALYAKASRAPYNASQQALAYIGASAEALQRFVDASGILDLLPASQASYGSSADFEFSNLSAAWRAPGLTCRPRSTIRSSAQNSHTRRSCCKVCATCSSGTSPCGPDSRPASTRSTATEK